MGSDMTISGKKKPKGGKKRKKTGSDMSIGRRRKTAPKRRTKR